MMIFVELFGFWKLHRDLGKDKLRCSNCHIQACLKAWGFILYSLKEYTKIFLLCWKSGPLQKRTGPVMWYKTSTWMSLKIITTRFPKSLLLANAVPWALSYGTASLCCAVERGGHTDRGFSPVIHYSLSSREPQTSPGTLPRQLLESHTRMSTDKKWRYWNCLAQKWGKQDRPRRPREYSLHHSNSKPESRNWHLVVVTVLGG